MLSVAGAILEAADNFIQLTKSDGYIPGGRLPTLARGRTQRDSRSNTPKTLLLVRAVDLSCPAFERPPGVGELHS